jgi:Acetyltransferase (GNAT) domain
MPHGMSAKDFLKTTDALPKDSHDEHYEALFTNERVMSKYGTGKPYEPGVATRRIRKEWIPKNEDQDPFSGFAAYYKVKVPEHDETQGFFGHLALGTDPDAIKKHQGQAEFAILSMPHYWKKGLGKEAAKAVVEEFAVATTIEGSTLDGKPLNEIIATASDTNTGSKKNINRSAWDETGCLLRCPRSIALYCVVPGSCSIVP